MKIRILTGITTSGTPHIGNYVGAIRPAIQNSKISNVESFFFLADYHALVKCANPMEIARSSLEIAATWLAAGLDPNQVIFYRQSDIPEILEMCWILTCLFPKGMMNRCHAYKFSVQENISRSLDPDYGITMGLFSYPILMAADILLFKANRVPVGEDQIQHLEMSRTIAKRVNRIYKRGLLPLPEILKEGDMSVLPGLDGRKMSKSYKNTIPLFSGGSSYMHSSIMRILTDSCKANEPKSVDRSPLYLIYKAFSSEQETQIFREHLESGMSWFEAKEVLYKCMQKEISPMREKYMELIEMPSLIEDILESGASTARKLTIPFIQELKELIGIRKLQSFKAL